VTDSVVDSKSKFLFSSYSQSVAITDACTFLFFIFTFFMFILNNKVICRNKPLDNDMLEKSNDSHQNYMAG